MHRTIKRPESPIVIWGRWPPRLGPRRFRSHKIATDLNAESTQKRTHSNQKNSGLVTGQPRARKEQWEEVGCKGSFLAEHSKL